MGGSGAAKDSEISSGRGFGPAGLRAEIGRGARFARKDDDRDDVGSNLAGSG